MTLIEKLEAATEGSRELSDECLLAVGFRRENFSIGDGSKANPFTVATGWRGPDGTLYTIDRPDPSQNVQDAIDWMVPEGWAGGGRLVGAPPFPMELVRLNKPGYVSSTGQNPALALSAASLKAHAAVKETEK